LKNSAYVQSESCWDSLLLLAEAVRAFEKPIYFCSLRFGADNAVKINSLLESRQNSCIVALILDTDKAKIPLKDVQACFVLKDFIHVTGNGRANLSEQTRQLIITYAPYCFASLFARRKKRTFTVSHLAQSLDSRIATLSGDSKWIGSPANFVHSHRMRALCDGVLIGAKTLYGDRPQLTVRHVKGRNPVRIALGASINSVQSLIKASDDPVILIGTKQKLNNENVKMIDMPRVNGLIPTFEILQGLYKKGIYSIYIEGGAITVSQFLKENNIDILQLHISPIMIGKGKDSFQLPSAEKISSSYRFKTHRYVPVDDGIMFVGVTQHFK
jgi:riboflavin-specific deaminase-like protein